MLMSYAAAIDRLFALVPELYTQPGQPRRKFSLDEVAVLLNALGNPQRRFQTVLIAGTNGKGSTAATLASILCSSSQNKSGENAHKSRGSSQVGLYTSPHLERVNERIRVGSQQISEEDFARHYFAVQNAAQQQMDSGHLAQMPSFFEMLTCLAFLHFAEAGVEIAVLEVGMGGRLDATNIVDPLLAIVTDISLDHTEWLGATIAEIACEKAGILRANGTLITLPQHPEANRVLGERAIELNVRSVNAAAYMPPRTSNPDAAYTIQAMGERLLVDSPLQGLHQQRNIALAIAAAVELAEHTGFRITPQSIERGVHETIWPGRMERFIDPHGRQWLLDVAHNPAGAWALRAALGNPPAVGEQLLIFSCLRDKPLAEMAQILFPLFDRLIVAPIHSMRANTMDQLLGAAQLTGTPAVGVQTIQEAIDLASQSSATRVVVSGSAYLVGEARPLIRALASGTVPILSNIRQKSCI